MKLKITRYEIMDDNIKKELSGYRIALFSDTHNMYYGPKGEKLLKIFENEKPDLVCFAGDAVKKSSRNTHPESGYDNALELFSGIAEKFTLYYVNGNHDRRWKKRSKNMSYYGKYISDLKKSGVHFLSNEAVSIAGGQINLVGLDLPLYYYKGGTKNIGNLTDFIGKSKKDCFNLLLAHTPKFFSEYVSWGADLTLCGHTHGGIFRLPKGRGVLSPTRSLFPALSYGLFSQDDKKMIVSSGAGDHNPRIEFNNPYEVVIITLKAKEPGHGA